jgi:hypothetical protein
MGSPSAFLLFAFRPSVGVTYSGRCRRRPRQRIHSVSEGSGSAAHQPPPECCECCLRLLHWLHPFADRLRAWLPTHCFQNTLKRSSPPAPSSFNRAVRVHVLRNTSVPSSVPMLLLILHASYRWSWRPGIGDVAPLLPVTDLPSGIGCKNVS